ncbi:unnamed protein product, partial [Dovyalis caffra]
LATKGVHAVKAEHLRRAGWHMGKACEVHGRGLWGAVSWPGRAGGLQALAGHARN